MNELNNVNDPATPVWARTLINCMKVIITELNTVKDLANRVNELEKGNALAKTTLTNVQQENLTLHDKIAKLEYSLDDQEQRNRNYCLMLHGIEESDGEQNTDKMVLHKINEELGLNPPMEMASIQRSHRVGRRNDSRPTRSNQVKPRPIIIRFRDWSERVRVFKNKRQLKGKGISITENLTKKRMQLLQLAKVKFGHNNVWTIEGRITTKVNNRPIIIQSEVDLA